MCRGEDRHLDAIRRISSPLFDKILPRSARRNQSMVVKSDSYLLGGRVP
jgi:hypothetical protein